VAGPRPLRVGAVPDPGSCSPRWAGGTACAQGGRGRAGRAGSPGLLGPAPPDRSGPDLNRVVVIRFLTEVDYPPFNFAGGGRQSAGASTSISPRMFVRGAQARLHHPECARFETLLAALDQKPRRRGSSPRSRSRPEDARQGRLHRFPITRTARPVRGRAAISPDRQSAAREASKARKVAVVGRHRPRGLSQGAVSLRWSCAPIRTPRRARTAPCARARVDLLFGDAVSLAFLAQRHRFQPICCVFSRRSLYGQPATFGEGRRHRGSRRATRPSGLALNWALFRVVGSRGPLHTDLWAALFSRSSPF